MSKQIGQITYKDQNLPSVDGNGNPINIFAEQAVYSLAIYGLPGIKFKLNNSSDFIALNNTGIFQYTTDTNPITSLTFANGQKLEEHQFMTIDYIYIALNTGGNN